MSVENPERIERRTTRRGFLIFGGSVLSGAAVSGGGLLLLESGKEEDERFNVRYRQAAAQARNGTMSVEAYASMKVEYGRRTFFRDMVYPLIPPVGLGIALVGSAAAYLLYA